MEKLSFHFVIKSAPNCNVYKYDSVVLSVRLLSDLRCFRSIFLLVQSYYLFLIEEVAVMWSLPMSR